MKFLLSLFHYRTAYKGRILLQQSPGFEPVTRNINSGPTDRKNSYKCFSFGDIDFFSLNKNRSKLDTPSNVFVNKNLGHRKHPEVRQVDKLVLELIHC